MMPHPERMIDNLFLIMMVNLFSSLLKLKIMKITNQIIKKHGLN